MELFDQILIETGFMICEFEPTEYDTCEKCNVGNRQLYFASDGGYEPRDGTYLCKKCIVLLHSDNMSALNKRGV